MKKQKNYGPYLFATLYSITVVVTNKLFLKPGFIVPSITFFALLVGLWHLIERTLNLPKHKWLRWIYMIVGISIYIFMAALLDLYVFHLLMEFTGFGLWQFCYSFGVISLFAILFIESLRWMRERENAEVENLTLQAENIEANFQLLKEQVNPDFLFYCLHQLQKMAKIEDPNMENYILKLADVYRQFLKKDTHSHILGKEIALFQSYVYLICYGRETTLSVVINVSDVALDRKIPLFALQMFADNYIKKHALSEKEPLHLSVYQKEAESITITHNQAHKMNAESMNTERLEICYHFEGVENGVKTEKEGNIYSTTLSLF